MIPVEARIDHRAGAFHLDVDLSLKGPWVAVFGPSGSGKTTLLECVAGLRRPQGARIAINGREVHHLPARERRIGYVSQGGDLFPHLTVRENIAFARRTPLKEDILDVLELHPLLDRPPATLSGGERQRVALARALHADPDVLLLDEPLSALDAALRHRIMAYVAEVKRRVPIPCLYVTHSVEEVLTLADDVALLDAGRIVDSGPPSIVLTRPSQRTLQTGVENIVHAQVCATDPKEGITTTDLGLVLPYRDNHAVDQPIRIRIRANDVVFALAATATSARNDLPGRVVELVEQGHDVFVRVRCGERRPQSGSASEDRSGGACGARQEWDNERAVFLWGCITPAALHGMGLSVAMDVRVLIKSHAMEQL